MLCIAGGAIQNKGNDPIHKLLTKLCYSGFNVFKAAKDHDIEHIDVVSLCINVSSDLLCINCTMGSKYSLIQTIIFLNLTTMKLMMVIQKTKTAVLIQLEFCILQKELCKACDLYKTS